MRHNQRGHPASDTSGSRLTNTTVGVLLATIDASIMIIAMPDIFRGIHLDPLISGDAVYLLWLILGYLPVARRVRPLASARGRSARRGPTASAAGRPAQEVAASIEFDSGTSQQWPAS